MQSTLSMQQVGRRFARKVETMESLPFCNIGPIAHCKSIEQVISPMAAQFCRLIISADSDNVENSEAFANLTRAAEGLTRTTYQLAAIAKRWVEESEEQEMWRAAESVLLAGKSILLAAQKLHIQPEILSHKEELIAAAQRILVGTLQILQTEDDAGVRKTVQVAHWLLDCLSDLESAGDVSALLSAFHRFSEALLLLNNLTEKRIFDLKDEEHQKNLSHSLKILKKCIPMLHTATHSYLKHPQNEQLCLAKSYIIDLFGKTVRDLIFLLMQTSSDIKFHDDKSSFSHQFNQLLELLTDPTPANLCNGNLDFLVGAFIFYCMYVAESSSRESRIKLLRQCSRILGIREMLSSHLTDTGDFSKWQQNESTLNQLCSAMKAELRNLDQALVSSTHHLILNTFTHSNEHLETLIKAALQLTLATPSSVQQGDFLSDLQPLMAAFHHQADQMFRVASIVSARCPHSKTAQDIESAVGCLRSICASVAPILVEVRKSPQAKEILIKLQTLYKSWVCSTKNLVVHFDDFVNVKVFLDLCLQRTERNREDCEMILEGQQQELFTQLIDSLCNETKHIVQVIIRYVDKKQDPIFRNGLLALLNQLENAIAQVRSVRRTCLDKAFSIEAKAMFLDKLQCMMDSISNVKDGLDGFNHPDILSPLREHVRRTPKRKGLTEQEQQQSSDIRSNMQEEDHCAFLEYLSKPLPPANSLCRDGPLVRTLQKNITFENQDLLSVVRELITATKRHDVMAVNIVATDLLELSNSYIEAAKVALPIVQLQESDKLRQHAELRTLTSNIIRVGRAEAISNAINMDGLLEIAILLSDQLVEMKRSLVEVAGIWYKFSQQLFCPKLTVDFSKAVEAFEEAMQWLSTTVQLAGETCDTGLDKGINKLPGDCEMCLEIQAKLAKVKTTAKNLLKKAMDYQSCQPSKVQLDSLEGGCILWSVAVQQLMKSLDQFIGEDILLDCKDIKQPKPPIKQKMMASILEYSLRLQEAAGISLQCCADKDTKLKIQRLQEKVEELTEALSHIAKESDASSMSAHAELMQRQLFLNAKVLQSYLKSTNKEYTCAIQGMVNLVASAMTACEMDKKDILKVFNNQAEQMNKNIQMVKTSLTHTVGSSGDLNTPEGLADHLALLFSDLVGRARQMLEDPHQEGVQLLENIVWEWSAKAHFLVAQLQIVQGEDNEGLDRIRQCLQKSEAPNVLNQVTTPLCHTKDEIAEQMNTEQDWHMHRAARALVISDAEDEPEVASELEKDEIDTLKDWQSSNDDPIVQVTKEMEKQMSFLAQYLNKEGPIQTKDQLVASTRKIASCGKTFAKFAQIIAQKCLDKRCAMELSSVIPQIDTVCNQLTILSSVKASVSGETSTDEVLVKNAENLIHAVLRTLKAAEGACVRGLQPVSPNAEKTEIKVTAFCMQWRKMLLQRQATFGDDKPETDELGLRKVNPARTLTLTSMVHVPLSLQ